MLKYILNTSKVNLGYALTMLKDIPDEKMAQQPVAGMNHPAFIIGHLTASADWVATMTGGKSKLDPTWGKLFGGGAECKPLPDRKLYPSKADLVKALEDAYSRMIAGLSSLSPTKLEEPFPYEPMRASFPTTGDGMVFMVTSHDAGHLGQLSAWRRAMGYKPLF